MKIIAKPVEVIAHTNEKGEIRPYRFRLKLEGEPEKVIKIDRILSKQLEKLAGNPMILYRCAYVENDIEKVLLLKYELNTCKWILFRI